MIRVAKTAGFCFGVKRAVDLTTELAKEYPNRIFTLGQLIHNNQVENALKDLGVHVVEDISELPQDGKLIIRTHGVPESVCLDLEQRGVDTVDATCPFVKKIHRIVSKHYREGYRIVIVGDPQHPEVIGINGWCSNTATIVSSLEEIEELKLDSKTCVVSQTTFSKENFKKIKKFLKNTCQSVVVFDTICSATEKRQEEAEQLARQSDVMLVIGGRHSSNTLKLAEICRKYCPQTYHVETASELPKAVSNRCTIGVTAGASSPEWIIKEVIFKMSEENKVVGTNEMSFEEALAQTLVSLRTGDIVKGIVIDVTPTEVTVDLGVKQDGIIKVDELTDEPGVTADQIVKVGDEIEAFVIRVSDVEGVVGLSRKKLDAIAGRKKLEEALETKAVLTGKVVEAVNGGVIVLSQGSRIFVPASQASVRYLSDLSTLVGDEVSFRIIDMNPRRRKLIGSIKSVALEAKQAAEEKFWADAEVGKEYKGVVKSLTPFGAFVDIGGIDGLVHISELSWSRIKHPSEVLKEGQEIVVHILALDKEKNKISLGYKKAEDNPWNMAKEKIQKDDVITVKIVRLAPFGAFAEILPTVDGLIHISQISNERIAKPGSVLAVGDEVEVKVIDIDWENQKISLSRRVLLPDYVEPAAKEDAPAEEAVEEVAEEAPVETVEAPVEEAAAEAVAEEAPVEAVEAPAEEAPEAVVEEAPAEEAPVEE